MGRQTNRSTNKSKNNTYKTKSPKNTPKIKSTQPNASNQQWYSIKFMHMVAASFIGSSASHMINNKLMQSNQWEFDIDNLPEKCVGSDKSGNLGGESIEIINKMCRFARRK